MVYSPYIVKIIEIWEKDSKSDSELVTTINILVIFRNIKIKKFINS